MGLKRKGLPAHVQQAIDNATPGQLSKMLDVGASPGYRPKKSGRPRAVAIDAVDKRAEREAARKALLESMKVLKIEPGRIELSLPYPVSANVYWRTRVIVPKRGRAFASTYLSEEAVLYKEVLTYFAKLHRIEPLIGLVNVEIHFYRPQQSGDIDNRIKPALDALKQITFADDKVVKRLVVDLDDDKTNPRAVVRVVQRAADLFGGVQ